MTRRTSDVADRRTEALKRRDDVMETKSCHSENTEATVDGSFLDNRAFRASDATRATFVHAHLRSAVEPDVSNVHQVDGVTFSVLGFSV